jgi:hypothetical protein
MNMWTRFLILTTFAALSPAAPVIFFGEDPGAPSGTPITGYPNSFAARNDFVSYIAAIRPDSVVRREDFSKILINEENGLSYPPPWFLYFGGSFNQPEFATLRGVGQVTSYSSPWHAAPFLSTSRTFFVNFNEPVFGFGFYGIDIGDFGGQLVISRYRGSPQTINIGNSTAATNLNVLFWGIVDTEHPFTRVTFTNTKNGLDVFWFDDLLAATAPGIELAPAPEPASFLLSCTALVAAFLVRRRWT